LAPTHLEGKEKNPAGNKRKKQTSSAQVFPFFGGREGRPPKRLGREKKRRVHNLGKGKGKNYVRFTVPSKKGR